VGATYAGGGTPILEGTSHLFQLRLSKGAARGLAPRPNPWVTIDLHALLSPQKGSLLSLLPQETQAPYLSALALLRRLSEDPRVDGVVVRVAELDDIGSGKVEELRDALAGVARSGKRLFALLTEGGDSELYLATAAEKIFTVPQATLLINGFSSTALFLGDALGKAGVTVDVARVGEFKNAPDEFTRSSMSPAQKEAMGAYLDGIYSRYLATVGKARNLSKEKLEEALSSGILSPRAAKEAGLVDDVLYPDELQEVLNKAAGHTVDLVSDYGPSQALARRWGERPKIAVVNVEGTIADGASRSDPLGAVQIAGAETILKALEAAAEDASVVAIVLRVDSPGGSGAASDLLWRAARKLRERKPIVASMGDYAASGGYYIAMAADEIVAEPSTLTGSIGVFALKPNFGPLMGKLGVNADVLKRGERADLFSLARPWTEGEQQAMQRYVDDFYDTFITKVAESRKLEKGKVDEISRGRVWSGAAAKDLGLVDQLGGLSEAIGRARARANLAPGAEVEVVLLGGGGGLFSLTMAQEEASGRLARALGDVAVALGLPLVDLPSGPLAMLPFRLRVK
jgi:protease-4